MLDFLATISDSIVTLFSFLLSSVQNLAHVLSMLAYGSTFLTSCIAFLPSFVGPFAGCAIVISVVYLIIGR